MYTIYAMLNYWIIICENRVRRLNCIITQCAFISEEVFLGDERPFQLFKIKHREISKIIRVRVIFGSFSFSASFSGLQKMKKY